MINISETIKVKKQLNEKVGINLLKYSQVGFRAILLPVFILELVIIKHQNELK